MSEKLLEELLLFMVPITVEATKGAKRESDAFSCFVMEVMGQWFLVTAGHVIQRLEALQEHYDQVDYQLFDGWNPSSGELTTPVPFNLNEARKFKVDEDNGLDLGCLEIPQFIRRSLEKHGIKALSEIHWKHDPRLCERYFLLGLPTEFLDFRGKERVIEYMRLGATLIPADPVPEPQTMKKEYERICGKVADQLEDRDGRTLADIDGMSGGPIFGIRKVREGYAYSLVGIQSAWMKGLRVIAGTPALRLGLALEEQIRGELAPPAILD